MSDPQQATPSETEVKTTEAEINRALAEPVASKAEAEEKIESLQQLISDLRSDQSKDRKTRDNLVGELRAEIEDLKDALKGVRTAQERANRSPKQTMVPPPPPPQQEEVDRPLPPNEQPRRRGGFFENVW